MSPSPRQSEQRSFLVLPENELAVAAVKRLAPGVKRRRIWMVTIIGPSGCGKSHLARELLRSWEAEKTGRKLHLLTASQFAAQLADASASGTLHQFQARYRHDVDLLICEDVQAIAARKETQQQLVAVVDEVVSNGGVVLLTATKMPGAIKGLSRRLESRMRGSLCVEIELPGEESRRQLVEQFLTTEALPLTNQEINDIVTSTPATPRELLGVLNQLLAESRLRYGQKQDRKMNVGAVLADRQSKKAPTLPQIAKATAEQFGVTVAQMKGTSRSQALSLARQSAMYLAREIAQIHYSRIGTYFNRENHSTVIHACRKIAKKLESDSGLAQQLQEIRDDLGIS